MRPHRLGRLTSLTQGAALVGLGLAQVGCGKDAAPPAEPLHINALPEPAADAAKPIASAPPVEPAPSSSATSASAPAASSVGPGLTRPMLNAPPKKLPPAPTKP